LYEAVFQFRCHVSIFTVVGGVCMKQVYPLAAGSQVSSRECLQDSLPGLAIDLENPFLAPRVRAIWQQPPTPPSLLFGSQALGSARCIIRPRPGRGHQIALHSVLGDLAVH